MTKTKKYCKRGHEQTEGNVYVRPNGKYSYCKICMKITKKEWHKIRPWTNHLQLDIQRCNNPKSSSYSGYGAKGIKMLATVGDFKTLWFRDKAYNLKRPSIDRKDSKGNYTLENCRFIEMKLNSRYKSTTKLTEKLVKKIRRLYKTGTYSHRKLGNQFGVSRGYISYIINYKVWRVL